MSVIKMSLVERNAVKIYNDVCDMLEGSVDGSSTSIDDIIDMLTSVIDIITQVHEANLQPTEDSNVLLGRACILLGQLIEWKSDEEALALYQKAALADHTNPEASVQMGRCLWKNATCCEQLKIVEMHLRHAIEKCDILRDCHSDADSESPDATAIEANNLLARLLSQSVGRESEAKALLSSVGYKFTLSPWITSLVDTSENQPSTHRLSSKRLQSANVCVFDEVLSPIHLQYMQDIFSPKSPFWPEHAYDSPSSRFFSYQIPLVQAKDRNSKSMCSFDSVVHSIWDTAQNGMKKLKDAKFAEWWCHSRPHCNGHKLHYDFVTDDGIVPRFPIASTVTFITADCGGPTLITDQQMTSPSPRSHHGWMVQPRKNRLVCFNGSLLHCVLPGHGPSPSVDARRVTFMIAFWKDDPRAPRNPYPGKKRGSSIHLKWPFLLTQPMKSMSKQNNKKRKIDSDKSDSVEADLSHSPQFNIKAVVHVEPVVDVLDSRPEETLTAKQRNELRRRVRRGVDLLDDRVFTYFEALNSGLVLSEKGICSLNCGGTCALCSRHCDGTMDTSMAV